MANIRNFGSILTGGYSSNTTAPQNHCRPMANDIVKCGILLKRKNMKERYFVLRRESGEDHPARLECYDSLKKFEDGGQPKRTYVLKDCFHISRKTDKKHFVIALYINKDCVGLVTETETEMKQWLQCLQYHKDSSFAHIETRRIDYDHVWQVEVQPRSLAFVQNLTGKHWLCLTSRLLSLVRLDNSEIKKEFLLSTIKKCSFLGQFFSFQLGRFSGIGCGDLFMKTEDSFIAQNIHNSVGSAMNNFKRTSSLTDSDIRKRTPSDPQEKGGFVIKPRERADSVPNNPRTHFGRLNIGPSLEKIQQQSSSDVKLKCFSEDEDFATPDKEFSDFDEEFPHYIPMNSSKLEFAHSQIPCSTDDGYVPMDANRDKPPPNSLGISPRMNVASPSMNCPVVPNLGLFPSSMSPVSPSSGPMNAFVTPTNENCLDLVSTPSHEDVYVAMQSPGSQGPSSGSLQTPSNHYIPMGPIPTSTVDGRRVPSTTPFALSPTDDCIEDSCELYGASETSSCTSGNSDHRIHDLAGDERGSTPLGLVFGHPLAPGISGIDDPDDFGGPRPNRTSSVGSKPEQFKKKTRLDQASSPAETSCRVRAFSLGSRMSHKYGLGRTGNMGIAQGVECHSCAPGEMYPLVRVGDKKVKNKSSSAPVLDCSLVSHSWSGTPGSYFRGIIQSRNSPRENNLMEMDFSKNRSCDVIPSEDKDREKKSSRDRLWHTFTGHRNRSNSKSSGGSGSKISDSWGFKEKRTSESEVSSRGIDLFNGPDSRDYLELDYSKNKPDSSRGYLPMHSPMLSSSLTANHVDSDKRSPRTYSMNENYLEMSSSLSSCASNDGYVDMTMGGSSCGSGLNIGSSSSSTTSISSSHTGGRSRRTSNSLYSPMTTSQELSSPVEDLESDKSVETKKSRRESKKRSFKNAAFKRKKSESEKGGGVGIESPEGSQKASKGPFASITNFISRNTSHGKSLGSNKLTSKFSKESDSTLTSLKRSKSKEKEVSLSDEGGEVNTGKIGAEPSSSVHPKHETSLLQKVEERECRVQPLDIEGPRRSSITELHLKDGPACSSPLSQGSSLTSPQGNPDQNRSYVNMQVDSSSPKASSLTHNDVSSLNMHSSITSVPSTSENRPNIANVGSSLMKLSLDSSKHHISFGSVLPTVTELEIKNIIVDKPANIERSRSHSGPGAPASSSSSSRRHSKGAELERTASACSSPVSYSPPTSPTLGSQSSMSSLSEGGLSSASSTCTVVNMGEKNALKASQSLQGSAEQKGAVTRSKVTSEEDSLNYVDLDLSSKSALPLNTGPRPPSPRLLTKNVDKAKPMVESNDLSYVQINFNKTKNISSPTTQLHKPQ